MFSIDSFHESERGIAHLIMDHVKLSQTIGNERAQKIALLDMKVFGMLLAKGQEIGSELLKEKGWIFQEDEYPTLPCIFEQNLESPIHFSKSNAQINISLEYIHPPTTKSYSIPWY